MMKIGMQTWGSHGDIRPLLALAQGLAAAGHEVSMVMCAVDGTDYSTLAPTDGLAVTLLDGPVQSAEEGQRIAESVYRSTNPLQQMKTVLRRLYDPVEDKMFESARQLAADSDLLIGHYFTHPLQTAAAQAGKPFVSVLLSHAGIPSAHVPPSGTKGLGKTGNRLLWWLTRTLLNKTLKPYPNRFRQRLGLPLIDDVLTQSWITTPLTLLAVSPQLCQPQPDWPGAVKPCGFFDTANFAPDGALPADLADFLKRDEAPVYITFGSWMPKDIDQQRATLALLTDAVTIAGVRAIIQGSTWDACGFRSSSQILYVRSAPHGAVFPHCSAIVHHGGAGTTQAATVAGKPSIVVAHLSEQEHWGQELRRIGVAGKTLKRRTLTAKALAHEIRWMRSQAKMRVHAEAAGTAMRRENGVAHAVKLIDETFGHSVQGSRAA